MARLGNSHVNDLKRLSEIEIDRLTRLLSELSEISPSIKVSALRANVSKYIDDEGQIGSLLRWAYFIRSVMAAPGAPNTAAEIISTFVPIAEEEHEVSLPADRTSLLCEFFESPHVYAAWQAQNLSRDAEHLYQNASIVLDIRPVFDESRTELVGKILMPFLKINFSDGEVVKSISVAMDSRDIRQIHEEVSKLERKIDIVKELEEKDSTYLVGEEMDFGNV